MRTFSVDKKEELLNYLFRVLSDTKKTRVKQYLKFKNVSVNGVATTRYNQALVPGDKVSIKTGKKELRLSPPLNVQIVFEDDYIVVADKPSGLLTIATEKVQDRTAIYAINDYLNQKEAASRHGFHKKPFWGKRIFIVHRLDKDTSGLIVFAKNAEVKFQLQENWEQVRKKYFAVVEGVPKEKGGKIESYLRENKILRMTSSQRPGPDAKLAVTHYQVLKTSTSPSSPPGGRGQSATTSSDGSAVKFGGGEGYSLLDIDLETGRKHQIRVHLSDMGCPVAGDKDYGSKTNPAGRLALHAYYLAFQHPVTGDKMEFRLELPVVLKRLLSKEG